MPNPIKYSTGSETLALKKGNLYIGTGAVGKGPTDSTGYYNGVSPSSGGYTIYMYKSGAPGNLSYHSAANDSQLISFTNNLAGTSYTGVQQCFDYYYGQTDKVCVNQDYPSDFPYIVLDGLILYLDAGVSLSYSGSGTSWYDVNGLGPKNNGTLLNGPTFTTDGGGCIVFDGVDDYAESTNNTNITGASPRTLSVWGYQTTQSSNIYYSICRIGIGSDRQLFEILLFNNTVVAHFWGGGQAFSANSDKNLLNTYTNITLTYDGTTAYIYVDGILKNQSNFSLITGNAKLILGRRAYSPHSDYIGRISNTMLYNRALTATEVLQNFNAQKGRFGL